MNAPLLTYRMTVEQFLDWMDARVAALPYDEPKWELFDGVPEMQEHETWRHAQSKLSITLAIRDAIRRSGLAYEVGIDGLGVRIGPKESYQPEAVVFPKGLIAETDRHAPQPIVVVEVLSPSTRSKDLKIKAEGYGRVASIEHYLVIDPETREVLHYRRRGEGLVPEPEALSSGTLRLEPPGLELDVAGMMG
ncbi:MAG: Uma2 family endonuclease [Hyphomicrobiaceae bacterium]|nr:Uma2 family endonuclease [Hyphomicrobiaceae bacterium]